LLAQNKERYKDLNVAPDQVSEILAQAGALINGKIFRYSFTASVHLRWSSAFSEHFMVMGLPNFYALPRA
jgi:hypothetical protein